MRFLNREEIELVKKLAENFPETPDETILRAFEAWKSEGYEIGSLVEIFYKALEVDETIEENIPTQTSLF